MPLPRSLARSQTPAAAEPGFAGLSSGAHRVSLYGAARWKRRLLDRWDDLDVRKEGLMGEPGVPPCQIGVPRFELGTSPTRTERATRLRHTPSGNRLAPGGSTGLPAVRREHKPVAVRVDEGDGAVPGPVRAWRLT